MFIVLQIPLIDGRRLHSTDATLLRKPTWAGPRDAGHEFLRSMGVIRERKRGGVRGWQSEDIFCSASHWLKCERTPSHYLPPGNWTPAFSRWMGDGRLMCRLELGWRLRLDPSSTRDLSALPWIAPDLFRLKARLNFRGRSHSINLGALPKRALSVYTTISTRHRVDQSTRPQGIPRLGRVLMYIEFQENELDSANANWTQVNLGPDLACDVSIWTASLQCSGISVAAYATRRGPSEEKNRALWRQIRLNILRMHSEIEGLDELTRWIQDGEPSWLNTERPEVLNHVLARAIARLRPDRGDLADHLGFRVARKAIETGTDGQIDRVLGEIRTIHEQLPTPRIAHLLRMLQIPSGTIPPNIDLSMNKTANNIVTNVGTMSGGQIVNAQGGAGSTVSASAQAGIDAASLSEAMTSLEKAITDVLPRIPDTNTRQELEMRLRDLKKQDKDPKWYEVTAQGLKDAAMTIGEIATPVVSAATAVLGLLAKTQ